MLIISWNVNSIKVRMEQLLWMIDDMSPDVILLQELKCADMAFPYDALINHPQASKYNVVVYGQKTYNGVAILSKRMILESQKYNFATTALHEAIAANGKSNGKGSSSGSNGPIGNGGDDTVENNQVEQITEARYIEAVIPYDDQSTMRIGSVYVPNGSEVKSPKFRYKLAFYDEMRNHMLKLLQQDEMVVIGGDLNVAPEAIDVYDPIGMDGTLAFHPEERRRFRQMISDGYRDSFRFHRPDQQEFSWWDYRDRNSLRSNRGMRIDHLLVSPTVADLMVQANIHKDFRAMMRPSDHAPVGIVF